MSAEEYVPSEGMAVSEDEGGLIDLTEDDWPSRGVWPAKENLNQVTYRDDFEPLAETDNAWNTRQREDDKRLNAAAGTLASRIDTLESALSDLENAFAAHNHDGRYPLKTQVNSKSKADDIFVNTNRPDSVEQMQGALGTPKVTLTQIENVEIFGGSPDGEFDSQPDTLHLRQIDGNNSQDNALIYERYDPDDDILTEVLVVSDSGDNMYYKGDKVIHEGNINQYV